MNANGENGHFPYIYLSFCKYDYQPLKRNEICLAYYVAMHYVVDKNNLFVSLQINFDTVTVIKKNVGNIRRKQWYVFRASRGKCYGKQSTLE